MNETFTTYPYGKGKVMSLENKIKQYLEQTKKGWNLDNHINTVAKDISEICEKENRNKACQGSSCVYWVDKNNCYCTKVGQYCNGYIGR